MKFRAAVLEKINMPLVIRELETTELKVGQVLVKVLMSGLCGSQVHELTGAKGNAKFLPHLMGHEGFGVVVKNGPGVSNFREGQEVIMHWRVGKGIESDYPRYILDGKEITSGKVTTLTEYAICSENRLTPALYNTPPELGCLLGCSLTTAFGVMDNDAQLKLGETVLILGAGGVGLNLIQAAKLKGARYVFVIEQNESKKALIESLGGITDHERFSPPDVIIDTTGNGKLIAGYMSFLASGGRFILVGQGGPDFSINLSNVMNLFTGEGKRIIASQGGQTNPSVDIPRYIKLYQSGAFSIDQLISHTFPFEQINDGFNILRSGEAARVMIKIQNK